MTSKGYMKDTVYPICIGEESFNLSYDDLVCLKYLLSPNGSSQRLQVPEYKEILSDDAKNFYSTIITRYKTMARDEKEAYIRSRLGIRRRTWSSGGPLKKYPHKWAKQFLRNQKHKIEDALNRAEQDRIIEDDISAFWDKLLPVE